MTRFHDQVTEVSLGTPTTEYAHAVLGDGIEYKSLGVVFSDVSISKTDDLHTEKFPHEGDFVVALPDGRVFEDIQARRFNWFVKPEYAGPEASGITASRQIAVVESDAALGAQLAVYTIDCRIGLLKQAATPHIGQRNRWLAPAGIADFDGDGQNDIAYVETPHLGKIPRVSGRIFASRIACGLR